VTKFIFPAKYDQLSKTFRIFAPRLRKQIKMDDKRTSKIDDNSMKAAEPVAVMRRQDSLDGMLAYITDQKVSAALRWELGHRLITDAEHDMQVRPAFELELQLRELQRQVGVDVKPDFDTFENAYLFLSVCKDPSLLSKASVYLTDHATVMLKIIIGETTSSVDIGREEFTYAIVNTKTAKTRMGRGLSDDEKTMKEFIQVMQVSR
jgi:hypothetical protein